MEDVSEVPSARDSFESLREPWQSTLDESLELLTELHIHERRAPQWHTVPVGRDGAPDDIPEDVSLAVMRRRIKGTDVYRATWTGTCDAPDPCAFLALLTSQALVPQWLPIVEGSQILETLGLHTRLCRIRFKFGWPASPRDAVVLAQVRHDASTLVLTVASVPRTPDAPSYLRPAPPYVRAQVHLLSLVVNRRTDDAARLRITAYWALEPRGSVLGVRPSTMIAPLPHMLPALVKCVQANGTRIAYAAQYGESIEIHAQHAEPALHLDYVVMAGKARVLELDGARAVSMPPRALRIRLAAAHGWDVRVARGSHPEDVQASVARNGAWYELDVRHDAPDGADAMVRMTLDATSVETDGVRLNGEAPAETRAPKAKAQDDAVLQRFAQAEEHAPSASDQRRVASTSALRAPELGPLASTVRRNYVYFASLLQEPEAKWTHVSDTRGVTVTKLDSIDPTLVVYRAEATFVGLSVWDLYSLLSTPALVASWSAGVERAELLEDLGGQSSVWHVAYRAAWPVSARDAALVQTVYKSPTSIHLFSFSADERAPPASAGTIRTHVDLQGWSIEALSPTTVHVTLIEQSDPRGWLPKTRIPPLMVAAMADAGERAIKHGGPPMVSRMLNARAKVQSYPPAMDAFHLEYVPCADTASDALECELRCDIERWAPNLDIRVTPPPTAASCLRRHALTGSGGLWLTLEHASAERVQVDVRKGPVQSVEHGVVLLNGMRVRVDTDELDAAQVQALAQKKRTKPQRVALDGPVAPTSRARPVPEAEAPVPDEAPPPAPPRMHAALAALGVLQHIHAEQPPDPAGAPAGWTLVQEKKGLRVRRRLLPGVSPLAVHRADKVVQGVAAEDLFPLVAYPGARAHWDEQLAECRVLESYGSGASVQLWTTPPSFAFQARAFVVASLAARGCGGADEDAAKSPVYFYASASCDEAPLPPALAEAAGSLPRGRVWIDGWILENIDPYSTDSYAIPSTRCTHVVAMEYGGMAAGLHALWNAALPRTLLALERGVATLGPCPSVRVPPTWLSVRGDDDDSLVWALRRVPRAVVLLASDFGPCTRTLSLLSRVVVPDAASPADDALRAASPPRLRPRTSATFRHEPPPSWCVAEVQVELRHYPHGYSVEVRWMDALAQGNLGVSPSRPPNEALPLEVHVLDRPPSALQVATHASAEQTHCHCVRVTLAPGAAQRPLTALVRVAIAPLRADGAPRAPGGHVPVTCNGRIAEIAYGPDARAPWPVDADALERVRADEVQASRTLEIGARVLANPLATVTAVRAPATASAGKPSEAPAEAPAAPPSPPAPATQLFGLLRPSGRYGSLASFVTGGQRPNVSAAADGGGAVSMPAHEPKGGDASDAETSGGEPPGALAPADAQPAAHGRYRLTTLILVMLVSFLAGSLVRAFMEPADFVLVSPAASAGTDVLARAGDVVDSRAHAPPAEGVLVDARRMLDMAAREVAHVVHAARQLHVFTRANAEAQQDDANVASLVRWRELHRFVDVGIPGLPWRWIVGVARA
ncbi:hypothetical protein MCAP1_002744 [Malassezia caprae]|uniref:START domain-containing protein n=1 Tax=Malassezia caprae TaxID=1381934 RepID=A0AAF0IXG0_9BASI|nr:hypothetical protein MCAP1_002744 [Malassezia caprae]